MNEKIPGTGISFKKGGLHESLGVPRGEVIPPAKMKAALAGRYGPKAKRQAELARTLAGMRGDSESPAEDKGENEPAEKPKSEREAAARFIARRGK